MIIVILQDSVDGKLSIQLRVAYSTLVPSATMTSTGFLGDTSHGAVVKLFVDTIRGLSLAPCTFQNLIGKAKI